ncbi:MAG: type I-E CRISPR-associated protein Cse1/CasA [Rhodopirellula sp.]|nr:type I-E CRISPR-associated protein Cse1/CasA [Rhodopirellula sp.]
MPFNLLTEAWIPVLWIDGQPGRVGIRDALTRAGMIRQIAASNPMDNVALLRFLLAVLMWCKEDAKSSLAALDDRGAGIPENWLAKLEENKPAFNLLGDGKRFYQDELLKGKECRPIADLLVEFPGADSVNFMRHVVHGSYGFCPACCAMGILRLSVWAPANGSYPASVNPGSAAYAFIEGKNLFHTLCRNLPDANSRTDQAPWLGSEQPSSPDAVAKLAWRPRKLWLNIAENTGLCAYCGQTGRLIDSLCIEKGWPTPVTRGQQLGKDVLSEFQTLHADYKAKTTERRKVADKVVKAAPVIVKCRMAALAQADSHAELAPEDKSVAAKIARVIDQLFRAGNQKVIKELTGKPTKEETPMLGQQDTQLKKFWVEDPHLLKEAEPIRLPDLSQDVGLHASKFWRDALRLRGTKALAIGIVGDGKYVFHDTPSVRLPGTVATTLAKLTSDCAQILRGKGTNGKPNESSEAKLRRRGILKTVTCNPDRQHPEIDSAAKLLTPNGEALIRDRLSQLNASAGNDPNEEKALLHEVYAPVVEQVIASVTPGSPLRRRAAKNGAQALLTKKIKELVGKHGQPSNTSAPEGALPASTKRGGTNGDQT